MTKILACIDASAYAASVCDLAAWASKRLDLPVELLHVVQRKDAVAQRHDLSGAIGLGAKTDLLEELTKLEEADARLQVERGRILLATMAERLQADGAKAVASLHRHGGIVETILERESDARVVVIGKRGASHEFASDHIGSKIERVVRASAKPVLIASRAVTQPQSVVLAYDGSKAADRALERVANSPLFDGLPVHVVTVGPDDEKHRKLLDNAGAVLAGGPSVELTVVQGKPEDAIAEVVGKTPDALLVMGAYGHSPLRTLIVGSTTTTLIRTVHVPVLLVR
ncbi:universal stress protein [Sphingobium yanoikuyae]|uniref:Universal stress protein n=1 Tax=Sphingobium yanoikuyae TaxID=13690 RepID=A0A6P1GN37_SPHYA|nr:universal stress protein [Sphingobium yanoikuyae]QHD69664.1 universal stress protein [Sphingobium yanoikuyae]